MKKIILFASGNGTNAENIIRYFQQTGKDAVIAVISNSEKSAVLAKVESYNIPSFVFPKESFLTDKVLLILQQLKPDLIVLAGFLLKFPLNIITAFPNKIINIHPALLPKYGGKGMYGLHVHQAVFDNREKETGISIHYIDEYYDNGDMIFQRSVSIERCKSAEEISAEVRKLEHRYFPQVIEKLLDYQETSHSLSSRVTIKIPDNQ